MDVKEAVKAAKNWVLDVMQEEQPTNLGLEEVEFDEAQHLWKITLGFSRPWSGNALSALAGQAQRAYRTIIVRDRDGSVQGMKRKLSADD